MACVAFASVFLAIAIAAHRGILEPDAKIAFIGGAITAELVNAVCGTFILRGLKRAASTLGKVLWITQTAKKANTR